MKPNIDKLFKQKLANIDTPTNANGWNEMELLVKRKNLKRPLWLFFLVSLSLLSVVGIYIYDEKYQEGRGSQKKGPTSITIDNNIKYSSEETLIKAAHSSKVSISRQTQLNANRYKFNDLGNVTGAAPLISEDKPRIPYLIVNETYTEKELEMPEIKTLEKNIIIIPRAAPNSMIRRRAKRPLPLSRWSMNIALSYGYISSVINLTNDPANESLHKDYTTLKNDAESLKGFVNLNIGTQYRLNNFLSFSGGLTYKHISQVVAYDFAKTEIAVLDSSNGSEKIVGYITLPPNQAKQLILNGTNQYHILELPLALAFNLKLTNKFQLVTSFGGGFSYIVGTSGQTLNPLTLEINKLNRSNAMIGCLSNFWKISAGIKHLMLPQTYFCAELNYGEYYTKNSLQQNYSFNNIGITAGLNFQLK